MDDQIICPHCQKPIPLSQAISAQIKDQQMAERKIFEEETRLNLEKKISAELELKIKDKNNEVGELSKKNTDLQNQLLDLSKLLRQMKNQNEQKDLEMEKKLLLEEEKIKTEAKKTADEENHLKILEKDKQLADALKVNDELKRKLQQGSQQNQGEVLELELENILKTNFPLDIITPIAKGVKGGDILEEVKDLNAKKSGSILWESKQTKNWTEGWIAKLKDDQRLVKAEIAVLVTEVLPGEINNFGYKNGIWIVKRDSVIGLATALRYMLIWVTRTKLSVVGKNEKMEILYSYISGVEFKQRIEALVDSFKNLQDSLEKEKRYFALKWAKEEKNLRQLVDQTFGMYGDLQGITGNNMPQLKS